MSAYTSKYEILSGLVGEINKQAISTSGKICIHITNSTSGDRFPRERITCVAFYARILPDAYTGACVEHKIKLTRTKIFVDKLVFEYFNEPLYSTIVYEIPCCYITLGP